MVTHDNHMVMAILYFILLSTACLVKARIMPTLHHFSTPSCNAQICDATIRMPSIIRDASVFTSPPHVHIIQSLLASNSPAIFALNGSDIVSLRPFLGRMLRGPYVIALKCDTDSSIADDENEESLHNSLLQMESWSGFVTPFVTCATTLPLFHIYFIRSNESPEVSQKKLKEVLQEQQLKCLFERLQCEVRFEGEAGAGLCAWLNDRKKLQKISGANAEHRVSVAYDMANNGLENEAKAVLLGLQRSTFSRMRQLLASSLDGFIVLVGCVLTFWGAYGIGEWALEGGISKLNKYISARVRALAKSN